MDKLSPQARRLENLHDPVFQELTYENLLPVIKNSPQIRGYSKKYKNLLVVQHSPDDHTYVIKVPLHEVHGVNGSTVYFLDYIDGQISGYSELTFADKHDSWGLYKKPYVSWNETYPNKDFERKGLAERRSEIMHKFSLHFLQEPIHSGVSLRKGTREMWEAMERDGRAVVVAESSEKGKRYKRTV